ncbi:hypothetical protein CDAR_78281 [Caerostris darwini]|uniref:Uncharacterized protein n=1 Tax=Caerostris darwini TaxID=1538125 RepID=A0AAV4SFI0_9ARAC|nr:hypothetical protein CDAR_78281 [Caerostris darwini]
MRYSVSTEECQSASFPNEHFPKLNNAVIWFRTSHTKKKSSPSIEKLFIKISDCVHRGGLSRARTIFRNVTAFSEFPVWGREGSVEYCFCKAWEATSGVAPRSFFRAAKNRVESV